MQSVINAMKEATNFNTDSVFLDIGSMGKPNFHAAQDPGVALSIGYEISEARRNSSILCKNRLSTQAKTSNCHFTKVDVASLDNLNEFTHVYTFRHWVSNSAYLANTCILINYSKPLFPLEQIP